MPANTRPKKFVARSNISHGTSSFAPGDEVSGAVLRALLAFGDKFVVEATKADTPAPTSVDPVDEKKEK